jgi:hypothetical protein
MKARTALLATLFIVSRLYGFPLNHNPSPMTTPLRSMGEGPLFYLDYSNLQGMNNKTFVEFYIQVGYEELQFIKYNGRFQASYDLDFIVYDNENNIIENYTTLDAFEVETFSETTSGERARISLVGFSFDPGQYQVKALLTDGETQKTSIIEGEFLARNFQSPKLMISDIQLSQKIEPAKSGQPYVKNKRYIEPTAVRIFAHGLSDIFIYFELYNLNYPPINSNSTYSTLFIFTNENGEKVAQFKRRNVKPGKTSAHSLKVPINYFAGGNYTLTVRAQDDDTGQMAESSKSFFVLDSPISLNDASPEQALY